MGHLQRFHLEPHPINGRHTSSSVYWYYLKFLTIFCFLHYCSYSLPCYTAGRWCPKQSFLPAAPFVRCLQVYCCVSLASRHAHLKLLFQKAADPVCSALNTVLLLRRANTHPAHVSVLEWEPALPMETWGSLLAKINIFYPCKMIIPVSSVCRFTQSQPTGQGFVTPVMTLMAHLGFLCTEHDIYGRLFRAYKKQYATFPASTCFPELHYWLCLKESAQSARVGLGTSNRSHWGGVAGACASAKSLSHTVNL